MKKILTTLLLLLAIVFGTAGPASAGYNDTVYQDCDSTRGLLVRNAAGIEKALPPCSSSDIYLGWNSVYYVRVKTDQCIRAKNHGATSWSQFVAGPKMVGVNSDVDIEVKTKPASGLCFWIY